MRGEPLDFGHRHLIVRRNSRREQVHGRENVVLFSRARFLGLKLGGIFDEFGLEGDEDFGIELVKCSVKRRKYYT